MNNPIKTEGSFPQIKPNTFTVGTATKLTMTYTKSQPWISGVYVTVSKDGKITTVKL
jgi:hypothetical protein